MNTKLKPWPISFLGILIVAAGLSYRFAWPAWIAHTVVVSSLPSRPDLTPWSPILSARINQNETLARSFLHPARALAELAQLYHANAFYPQADQCYQGLLRLAPSEARWPYLEANILAGFGRLAEALPLLQRTIELAPDYIPARLRTADALRKPTSEPPQFRATMKF